MSSSKSCFSGLHYSCPRLICPSPARDRHIHSASRRTHALHLSRHEVCAAAVSEDGLSTVRWSRAFPSVFAFARPFQQAELGLAENPFPPSAGWDLCTKLCSTGKASLSLGTLSTAASKHVLSTQDSLRPWGWGQLTWLPAVSKFLLRGCSSFATPQNGISTRPEK